jgi:hypothetical protein
MDVLIALVVIVAVAFVLGWALSLAAKQQRDITVQAQPADIVDLIQRHFGSVWWREVSGRGQLNFRARGLGLGAVLKNKPTLSIDVEQLSDSTYAVQVWMSAWGQQSGVVALADRVVVKRLSLFRKLRALNPALSASAPAFAPPAPAPHSFAPSSPPSLAAPPPIAGANQHGAQPVPPPASAPAGGAPGPMFTSPQADFQGRDYPSVGPLTPGPAPRGSSGNAHVPSDSRLKHAAIAICLVAVVAVVFAVIHFATEGTTDDAVAGSPNESGQGDNGGGDRPPVSLNGPTPCSSAPNARPESMKMDTDGLIVTTTLTSRCAAGDLVSNDRFRLTAFDAAGRDVASGVFDLTKDSIGITENGSSTATFVFPAGTYWRVPEATTGGVSLTAHRDGSDSARGSGSSSATSVTAFDVGTPEHGSLDAAAFSALNDIVAADRSYIDAHLLEVWQPQLSSKRPGLYYDGIIWQANDIVREHMQLRQRYPNARLVWSGDWPVYSTKNWWITVSGISMPDGPSANAWCAREGYDADHCFAKMLSYGMGEEGTTLNRK